MGKQPDPIPSLLTRLRKIEAWMARKDSSSPFYGTGMHPNGAGGLDSDNFVTDVSGYRLAETPEFNDVKLRGGIIGNDALSEPVRAARLHDDATGFAVGTGQGAVILSASVTVPAGYTQAIVLNLSVAATAINTTGSTDWLYAYGKVNNTSTGWQIGSADVPAGAAGVAYDISSNHITGLASGSSLTVTGLVSSGLAAWSASGSNVANIDAAILFLR